jgi:hypothetical protein
LAALCWKHADGFFSATTGEEGKNYEMDQRTVGDLGGAIHELPMAICF